MSATALVLDLARRLRLRFAGGVSGVLLTLGAAGCSPDQVVGTSLPPDIPSPGSTHTAAGALAAYEGALMLFRSAFAGDGLSVVPVSGVLTDELRSADVGLVGSVSDLQLVDSRIMRADLAPIVTVYDLLQRARGQAEEAHGLMLAYAPDNRALLGHLDALRGYTEIYLADLFCSGIPLSTLDFNGDFTYEAGSTTAAVYASASSLFDSAITLATDSARILNLARVGKGRALLALGQYTAAAQAVALVPDGFRYALDFNSAPVSGPFGTYANANFMLNDMGFGFGGVTTMTTVDREGVNGMPFISSGDPRSAATPGVTANSYGYPLTVPTKYDQAGDSAISVASAVEARLIQAETELKSGDPSWLTTLNALRTDGTFTTAPDSVNPAKTDTSWNAGTGGVAGLAPLADPGTQSAEVDLVFQERAYWLFLTGERQGDLRRLIRQYGRQPQAVYPTGSYPGAYGLYGSDVTAPIPSAEKVSNPLFTGCLDRRA